MPKHLKPGEIEKVVHCMHDDPCFYCGSETYDVIIVPTLMSLIENGVRVIRWGYSFVPLCRDCCLRETNKLSDEFLCKLTESLEEAE